MLKRAIYVLTVAAAIAGAGGSYYFYGKYQAAIHNPNPTLEAQKETDALVSDLGKLMELPQGEIPAIATISDKEKLKGQPFFKMGENGDKLFAYNTAMIAILYRPRTNKIINVAQISANYPQNAAQGASQ